MHANHEGFSMCISWVKVARFFTAEYLLDRNSNGGDIVLARSLIVAAKLAALTLILKNLIDPCIGYNFSWSELRQQCIDLAPWGSAVAGATYLALYDRFKSQWTYLAALYNQIKHAEIEAEIECCEAVQSKKSEKLKQWKAGYIEDAVEMHLHTKGNVAGIIKYWIQEPEVKNFFEKYSPSGCRWNQINSEVEIAYDNERKRNENMLLLKEKK
jgi:hypothetical protein